MIGLDFSVIAPLGFVAIGAMSVLMLEAFLSRSLVPGMSDEDRLAKTARIGTLLGILSSVVLVLAIYAASSMFSSGVQMPFNLLHPMLQLDPLSTFAIDVDSASNSNVRRFLELARAPHEPAIVNVEATPDSA